MQSWSLARRNAPRPALRDRLCVDGFLLLWILPSGYHGLSRAPLPGEPALLHDWHDIACLFSHRPPAWNIYFVEVRRQGRPLWEQLDEGLDFGLEPFGHRTRLHRFLVRWGLKDGVGRQEVAEYLVASDRARRPDAPIVALRFVWTGHVPDPARPPAGAWRRPPLADIAPTQRRIISVHEFAAGGAR